MALTLIVTIKALVGFLGEAMEAQDMLDEAIQRCDASAKDLLANFKGDAANTFAAEEEQFKMWGNEMSGLARQAFDVVRQVVSIYTAGEDLING